MPALPEAYQTRRFRLDIEGVPVNLDVVANASELLDQLIAKGEDHEDVKDERIPYWADLWPSAIALGRYLVENRAVTPGMTVTEMGCGLGLAGIVAGLLGAEVTLTDYLDEALLFARHNWSLNLDRPARFANMDWRQPDSALAADLVLAADLAYEMRLAEHLPNAFRTLCRPGGVILISEPNRKMSKPFFDSLPGHGFFVSSSPWEGTFNGLRYRVTVYRVDLLIR
jgi:predicted nicotinamide N-methyase